MEDEDMLQYQLQRENYWTETQRDAYPYSLNEKPKFMNKDIPKQCMENVLLKLEPIKNKYTLFNHKLYLRINTNFLINSQ